MYVVGLTHLPIHTLCVWVGGIGSNTHAMFLLLMFGRIHSTDLYQCIYTHIIISLGNTTEGGTCAGSMGEGGLGRVGGLRKTFRPCLPIL